jgi:2-isopropylmalate synthase
MTIHERHPYAGDLVFTAFSGSHQDAIKKGMDLQAKKENPDSRWEVPYLPIDPRDIGRTYQAIIRINSQSGKGGVAYIMSRNFGIEMPKLMHPELGEAVNVVADKLGRELSPDEIYEVFRDIYLKKLKPLELIHVHSIQYEDHDMVCEVEINYKGEKRAIKGKGNGPISAFVYALDKDGIDDFKLIDFHEHAIGKGSETEAVAYVQIELPDGGKYWGAGIDTNISFAGIKALISAYNRARG